MGTIVRFEREMSRQEIEGLSVDDLYAELALQEPFYIPDMVMTAPMTVQLMRWIERQLTFIELFRKLKIRRGRKVLSRIEGDIKVTLCDQWGACEKLQLPSNLISN